MTNVSLFRTLFVSLLALCSCATAQELSDSGQASVTIAGEHGHIIAGYASLRAGQHRLYVGKPLVPGIAKNLGRLSLIAKILEHVQRREAL